MTAPTMFHLSLELPLALSPVPSGPLPSARLEDLRGYLAEQPEQAPLIENALLHDGRISDLYHLAQGVPTGRPVDLRAEEALGGHTIRMHVGKSPEFLLNRVRTEVQRVGILEVGLKRAGSFTSLEAAERLVNATLARNPAEVEAVATGDRRRAFVTAEFSAPTGIEAFRSSPRSAPFVRDTTGVGVVIEHAPDTAKGFVVVTAFPRRD